MFSFEKYKVEWIFSLHVFVNANLVDNFQKYCFITSEHLFMTVVCTFVNIEFEICFQIQIKSVFCCRRTSNFYESITLMKFTRLILNALHILKVNM